MTVKSLSSVSNISDTTISANCSERDVAGFGDLLDREVVGHYDEPPAQIQPNPTMSITVTVTA